MFELMCPANRGGEAHDVFQDILIRYISKEVEQSESGEVCALLLSLSDHATHRCYSPPS